MKKFPMSNETEYSKFRAGKAEEMRRLELQAKSLESSIAKQVSLLGIKRGVDVLDAGCGTGSFARTLARIVFPTIVTGVDIDPQFIEEAKRLSEKEGVRNLDFEVGDIHCLDFPSQTFDLTYCKFVFPHLTNPSDAISELIRVTRKDGHVASLDEGGLYVYPSGSLDKFFALFGKLGQWRKLTRGRSTIDEQDTSAKFASAGLTEIKVFPLPTFASSAENPNELKKLVSVPQQMIDLYKEEVITNSFMQDEEYEEGMEELAEWIERPDSFWLVLTILTVGRVG